MKKVFSRLFGSVRKRLAAGAIVAAAVALPVATSAASMVNITAETTVSNATKNAGTMNWAPTASASYNEVVAVQVVYNNTEDPSSDKTANNLRVKINIPTTPGTSQKITTVTKADNSNTVNGSATINLNRADAYLQYIPGTATWKYADTANGPRYLTKSVSDDVVLGANGLVLHNEGPCQSGSIVVQARVMVPGLTIDKQVRLKGTSKWSTSIDAKSGDTVQYLISYKNTGNSDQQDVVIADKLPKGITYVPGSTYLANDSAPNGKSVTDGVVGNGIIVGTYKPGANAFVLFDAKVGEAELACGANLLRNIATVQPRDMNYYYNTADVNVSKKCVEPTYSCDLLTLTKKDDRMVTATVTHSQANGATYKSTSINWGDGTTNESLTHTYAKDGTYNVVASVNFTVNDQVKTATSDGCKSTVTITTPGKPVYSCDLLSLSQGSNRTLTASVAYTAQGGASFKTVTIDWGDSTTPLTTDKTTAQHQYAADGTFTVTAKMLFSVNGKDVYAADNANCVKQVSFTTPTTPTTPSELPNTGAGNVIGVFAAAVVTGTIGYRLFLSRKLSRR